MTILEFTNQSYSVVVTSGFKISILNRIAHTITEKQCKDYLECETKFNKIVLKILTLQL